AMMCFFFQAEDGIRDRNVTGVQTCALPISEGYQRFILRDGETASRPVDPEAGGPDAEQVVERLAASCEEVHEQRSANFAVPESRSEERRVGKECRTGGCADQTTEESMRDIR